MAVESPWLLVSLFLLYFGVVGAIIGSHWADDWATGFWSGIFMGPIGWIIAAKTPAPPKYGRPIRTPVLQKCEICEKEMDITDIKPGNYTCPFCGQKVEVVA
jgi:hypothetical protein